ncbi:hypothetical protein [Novosphingobium malaysiense]|uniref:hypothetical protein n=1 Tax=Novosphingobium malaysiense TaxID=1348853 RepID=UPI000A621150|nr:hypothetical protein [Novosphingobium malaysiense]
MKCTALVPGALVLGPLLGIVASQSVNTRPVDRGENVFGSIPQHAITSYGDTQRQVTPSPDHYPLITPHGRVEVHELWSHGLMRNRRLAIYDYYDPEPVPEPEPYSYDPEPSRTAHRDHAGYETAQGRASSVAGPDAEASPPGSAVKARGSARIIDVEAELASIGRSEPVELTGCADSSRGCGGLDDTAPIRPIGPQVATLQSGQGAISPN